MNSIEASCRVEIKDLFAAHFGRFEERLERHTAETATNFARFEEKFEHRLAATKAELRQEIAGLRVEIHSAKADLIKWTFVRLPAPPSPGRREGGGGRRRSRRLADRLDRRLGTGRLGVRRGSVARRGGP